MPQPVFGQPVFSEGTASADPSHFLVDHPSDTALYKQLGDALQKSTVSFAKKRGNPEDIYTLATAYGARGDETVKAIEANGKIVFHAMGDSGAANLRDYTSELHVADQLTADALQSPSPDRPAFLYHLGDFVYNFGESKYYYDQFYDPFRHYPLPILAIPGNHDSFIVPGTVPEAAPLEIFSHNFCANQPEITVEAGDLHRTAMTQPGVYFTLDAPFVRVIGLFSNALEDPGVISSEGGKWKNVPDFQLEYLKAQLKRIHDEKYAGAVLIALHHPPFSYAPHGSAKSSDSHSSSTSVLRQIDTICSEVGVYPHAVLSGHAHNYQRYTRTLSFGGKNREVPFIVCGSGGHHINRIVRPIKGQAISEPAYGTDVSYLEVKPAVHATRLVLAKYQDTEFGYLRVAVDAHKLRIAFHLLDGTGLNQSEFDVVTVNLATSTIAPN